MTVEELAKKIMDWADVDDAVAQDGWVGGIDEKWDNAKTAMVSAATEVLEKKENT